MGCAASSILPWPVPFDHLQQFLVAGAVAGHDLPIVHGGLGRVEAADHAAVQFLSVRMVAARNGPGSILLGGRPDKERVGA